jgi:putative ABC transport system permease protein
MSTILIAVVGLALGIGFLACAIGIPISLIIVFFLMLSLILGWDWVPVIYNLRSLKVRKVSTFLTGLGLALVVAVFAVVMMLSKGIKETLVSTGDPANVKILRKGAGNEVQSGLQPDQVRLLTASPEVALLGDGTPQASAESLVLIFALKKGHQSEQDGSNVTVRGVGPHALQVHSSVHINGRMVNPGTSEIVVGKNFANNFENGSLGGALHFARRDWTVVGIIDSGGSGFDSEIWGDVDQFVDAFQRRGAFSSLTMRLKDPSMLKAMQGRMAADPQLNQLEAKSETEYYASLSEGMSTFISALGMIVAFIFALGAALGAMITMYAQVAARTREIGTLRALGFRRRAVLVSFLTESMILGLLSGVAGIAIASLAQFASLSTMNFQTFSECTFKFVMTPQIIVSSLIFSAILGYAGGLLPAVRAARMPIVEATRGG